MAKYSGENIIHLAEDIPYKDLTPYQRKLVQAFNQPVSPGDIAKASGIPTREINRRIEFYKGEGLDPNSLRSLGKYGIVAKSRGGKQVVFYVIQNQNGQRGYFGSYDEIERAARDIEEGKKVGSPPLDPDTSLWIPTIQVEKEESEKYYSDQGIVRRRGEVNINALPKEQKPLAQYMRQHPEVTTLKEARAGMRKKK